jgi:hypothetical protein
MYLTAAESVADNPAPDPAGYNPSISTLETEDALIGAHRP